ncbi:hypothetical protein [Paraburkholderia aromaticivorans]|nr:hypothetical protein [Paraburkholderia aromaticivorans]
MCVAVASALAIGVMGTVAYSVWFNQDQQAYAEAIAGARQALGSGASASAAVAATTGAGSLPPTAATGPATTASPNVGDPEAGGQLASWSGEVTRRSRSNLQTTFVTDAASADPASSPASAHRSASAGNPPAQQMAPSRVGKDNRAPQERRTTFTNAKHKDNAFTRIGLFFRRVDYRQHGNANRQDLYSHP